jgi:hypothetical protein
MNKKANFQTEGNALAHHLTELTVSSGYEICCLCGRQTPYRTSDHIDLRLNYVEGAGQLCEACAAALLHG